MIHATCRCIPVCVAQTRASVLQHAAVTIASCLLRVDFAIAMSGQPTKMDKRLWRAMCKHAFRALSRVRVLSTEHCKAFVCFQHVAVLCLAQDRFRSVVFDPTLLLGHWNWCSFSDS